MRGIYKKLVPYETRYWLYKIRNPKHFRELRKASFPSEKGTFSLREFDKNNCIFVHITKTAGTSVAESLFGVLPYHYTAIEYRIIYGRKTFHNYYKFAFVRNPWDRLYSAYSYLKDGGWNEQDKAWYDIHLRSINSFEQFVLEWLDEKKVYEHIHFHPQSHFICDRKGNPIIDYLCYFETIADDFEFIKKKLEIESQLKNVNSSNRIPYKDIYSPEMIKRVREVYATDVDNFGYEFNGIKTRMNIHNRRFVPA